MRCHLIGSRDVATIRVVSDAVSQAPRSGDLRRAGELSLRRIL